MGDAAILACFFTACDVMLMRQPGRTIIHQRNLTSSPPIALTRLRKRIPFRVITGRPVVWFLLHIISTQYKRHGTKLRATKDLKPLLAVAKKSRKYYWLKDFDSIALQQACINLDQAFQNFFDPKSLFQNP
ncbi:hypothetical protein [Vreelandella azerica]|uniref:hypothetical protein n=1 Tax=Vreelandella azerica TaxID=2732867 RepID=UPI001F4268BA|nr:hypothetical protein [Halomonas azerica]